MVKYIALLMLMLAFAAGNTWTQCDYDYVHDHYDYDGLLDFIWCPIAGADGYDVYVCQKPAGDASYKDEDFKFVGKTDNPHFGYWGIPGIWYRTKVQAFTNDGRVGSMSNSSEWVEVILKSWIALSEPKPGLKMELSQLHFSFTCLELLNNLELLDFNVFFAYDDGNNNSVAGYDLITLTIANGKKAFR